jgi:hypothetical protein
MSSIRSKIICALFSTTFLAAFVPGCGAGDFEGDLTDGDIVAGDIGEEELGQMEQGMCANGDGVNSAMAALAVATAKELRRFQPTKDFYLDSSGRLALTSTGKAQCADGKCWNTQATLDLQKAAHNTVKFGSVVFNADNYRSRLHAEFQELRICESRGPGANCPVEDHKLVFKSAAAGACDTVFTFTATTPTGGLLSNPGSLKNKLVYVGYPENDYLAFSSTSETISIDPTIGLNDTGSTSSGSCTAACTKISSTDMTGACCSCNGASKKFVKSAWSTTTFLCQ